MARSRNPEHRGALLRAATLVFGEHGMGATTASIAKEAGVSAGTLFVYFATKPVLVNALHVELKSERAMVATEAAAPVADPQARLRRMWDGRVSWSTAHPEKRRAVAQLAVAEDLTEASRAAVHAAYEGIAGEVGTIVRGGPLRDAPLGFALALMSSITDATLDDLMQHPDPTGSRSALAFDAMWRALAG